MLLNRSLVPAILADGVIQLAFSHRDVNGPPTCNTHCGCVHKMTELPGECPKRRQRVIDVIRNHVDNNIKGFAFKCSLEGIPILTVACDDAHIGTIVKAVRSASTIV